MDIFGYCDERYSKMNHEPCFYLYVAQHTSSLLPYTPCLYSYRKEKLTDTCLVVAFCLVKNRPQEKGMSSALHSRFYLYKKGFEKTMSCRGFRWT
jgi:hypothetical protein